MISCTADSPVGKLTLSSDGEAIVALRFGEGGHDAPNTIIKKALFELDEYFAGRRTVFDIPVKPDGTAFQTAVWNELKNIPYGQTRSYADVAAAIGAPRACRAVGTALHKNPVAILIPCHRVIGKDGSLTGFAGGVGVKKLLLALEKAGGGCFTQDDLKG